MVIVFNPNHIYLKTFKALEANLFVTPTLFQWRRMILVTRMTLRAFPVTSLMSATPVTLARTSVRGLHCTVETCKLVLILKCFFQTWDLEIYLKFGLIKALIISVI